MTPEEIIEVDGEPSAKTKLPRGTKLTKKEALALITYRMHEAGLVQESVAEKEAAQDEKEDKILKQFGM